MAAAGPTSLADGGSVSELLLIAVRSIQRILFDALRDSTTLQDWKYGWPHKFYVKGFPNALAGKQVRTGAINLSDRDNDKTQDQIELENPGFTNWHPNPHGHWEADRISEAPSTPSLSGTTST